MKNSPAPDHSMEGPACLRCGSVNTTRDATLRSKPSIVAVIFFGWLFLLIRGAFAMRESRCRDCNHVRRYKSVGSWVALCILIFIVLLIASAVFLEGFA